MSTKTALPEDPIEFLAKWKAGRPNPAPTPEVQYAKVDDSPDAQQPGMFSRVLSYLTKPVGSNFDSYNAETKKLRDISAGPPTEYDINNPVKGGIHRFLAGSEADLADTVNPVTLATAGVGGLARLPGAVGKLAGVASSALGAGFGLTGLQKYFSNPASTTDTAKAVGYGTGLTDTPPPASATPENVQSKLFSGAAVSGGAAAAIPGVRALAPIAQRAGGALLAGTKGMIKAVPDAVPIVGPIGKQGISDAADAWKASAPPPAPKNLNRVPLWQQAGIEAGKPEINIETPAPVSPTPRASAPPPKVDLEAQLFPKDTGIRFAGKAGKTAATDTAVENFQPSATSTAPAGDAPPPLTQAQKTAIFSPVGQPRPSLSFRTAPRMKITSSPDLEGVTSPQTEQAGGQPDGAARLFSQSVPESPTTVGDPIKAGADNTAMAQAKNEWTQQNPGKDPSSHYSEIVLRGTKIAADRLAQKSAPAAAPTIPKWIQGDPRAAMQLMDVFKQAGAEDVSTNPLKYGSMGKTAKYTRYGSPKK